MAEIIYLDNNSTTKIDFRVLNAMLPFFEINYANASSAHAFGNEMQKIIRASRAQVANLIGSDSNEIFFTAGATEAINIAIKGISGNSQNPRRHIVTVATEHPAVLYTCRYMETIGYTVTYLPVEKDGVLNLDAVKEAISSNTALVSVMFANNETGVIQPIKEIGAIAHSEGAIFMSDATQAVGKIHVDVKELGIDILCFSGHKFYGPKGVGALFVKKGIHLNPLIHGGGQEKGMRSGTLNVPAIVGFGKAADISVHEMLSDAKRIAELRDELENGLLEIDGAFLNGNKEKRLYNTSNICFPGIEAEILIGKTRNIAFSSGSACTSSLVEPSHVLLSLGLTPDDAFSSIRFSLGKYNTSAEIQSALREIKLEICRLKELVK